MRPEEAVAELAALVQPSMPVVSPAGDWVEFERRNGFPAPPDYRCLVDNYGTCGFGWHQGVGSWIYMLDPFDPFDSLVEQSDWMRRNHLTGKRQFPDAVPDWPMWPDAGGYLPWAATIDGDWVGWLTVGPPEWWGTAFYARDDDHLVVQVGAVEFLVGLLRGDFDRLSKVDAALQVFSCERRTTPPVKPPPRVSLQVELVGTPVGVDLSLLPPSREIPKSLDGAHDRMTEWHKEFGIAIAPAEAALARWRDEVGDSGLVVGPAFGWYRDRGDAPLRAKFHVSFPPSAADVAKTLLAEFVERDLGVGIRDIRDDDYEQWWPDLYA